MFRSGQENLGLRLLSLLLAVVLWVYVSNDQNPIQNQELRDIPVDVRGVGGNMAVTEYPGSVTVRLQADRNAVGELNPQSVEAFVDMTGFRPGRNTVPVQVKTPEGIKVVDISPNRVKVTLETVAEKQVQVVARVTGSPGQGYRVLDVQVRPDRVTVRGPKSVLERVDAASVQIEVNGRQSTFSGTLPVRVSDESGNFLESRVVRGYPETAEILVVIGADGPSKKVRVVPVITGQPAAGYTVTMTVVEPPEVVITGQSAVIGSVTQLVTGPINISGAKKDIFTETAPVLPPGVQANRQALKVLVKIGRE